MSGPFDPFGWLVKLGAQAEFAKVGIVGWLVVMCNPG